MQNSKLDTVSENVTTRPYTAEEMINPPWAKVDISKIPSVEFETQDYLHEDTMPIYMSLPRATWKIIFSLMAANNINISEVFMKIVSDMTRAIYEMSEIQRKRENQDDTMLTSDGKNYTKEIDRIEALVKAFDKMIKKVDKSKEEIMRRKREA